MRVEGPIAVVQLLETPFVNLINYASLVTTNAARHRFVAGKSKTLLEFGLRRAQVIRSGIPNFCAVALALNELGYKAVGIRLDSGDLAYLSCQARKIFWEFAVSGFGKTSITASNDLNEETLDALNKQIEPESQTKLLDATLNLEGVLLAEVPGAGEFDALCCYFERFKQQCDKNMELTQCSCPSG
ncbi:hypothetical protein AHAS_Ahas10G0082700 [Arachis hypogaea]